ncbi:unnamed protein product [Nyctereutes procyonoides]|uniref:(raccoon dog) hypothetical protein n=1 Tax=Nyctereutes procyonoides TaxID=34880 RepID=A0A811YBJ5_NYCPR|nr:unnamed protein product [Nyctereutes procyonoides]
MREKLGSYCKLSKDRDKIYLDISVESLAQEFKDYQFKETKEEDLTDFEELDGKLPRSDPLKSHATGQERNCFSSNKAARDFGGAVQDYFKWKADMTNFDVEVLLNTHDKLNITYFEPTTLRSTLANGMLRFCAPQPINIIRGLLNGLTCHIAGDNNLLTVNRAADNISSLLTKSQSKEGKVSWGLTGSVDIIVTNMPFGRRMAALLTQDKKCFAKALSGIGHVWWEGTYCLGEHRVSLFFIYYYFLMFFFCIIFYWSSICQHIV